MPALGREAIADCAIGGLDVKAGTTILMPQWVVQRDPRFFSDPERFIPERWQGGLAKQLPRFAYFPFDGGPRQCIGNSFAMMEATLVLATLAARYRLVNQEAAPPRPRFVMTLRPDRPVRILITPR